jgi:3,4-dihydroxy-2-butanone 4-phosphate synthase
MAFVASETTFPTPQSFTFDPMPEALQAFERGEFLLVMDDERRENEGDLIIAASKITTEKMAWFVKMTRYENGS